MLLPCTINICCIHGEWFTVSTPRTAFADEVASLVVSTMTTDKTDAILEKVGLQTNGDMFKELLKAANLAAEGSLKPLMFFDNEASHTQVVDDGVVVHIFCCSLVYC